MQESLIRSFETIYPLSEALKATLYDQFSYRALARKEVLLHEGQTCQYVYFVQRGLLRAYHYEGEKEVTNALGRMLTERYLLQIDQRARILCMPTARDKYLAILERKPELVQRVSVSHLASYLDMTIWTLSKVRGIR